MRYVAKIHVLDVMDQVVVSGYVYDAEGPVADGEPPLEFTYSAKGVGLSEPLPWLLNSLYRCLVAEQRPGESRDSGALVDGGSHTISETGDSRQNTVR